MNFHIHISNFMLNCFSENSLVSIIIKTTHSFSSHNQIKDHDPELLTNNYLQLLLIKKLKSNKLINKFPSYTEFPIKTNKKNSKNLKSHKIQDKKRNSRSLPSYETRSTLPRQQENQVLQHTKQGHNWSKQQHSKWHQQRQEPTGSWSSPIHAEQCRTWTRSTPS